MLGAGSILAGAFIGAGIGALSTTAMKAGEEISTGNVRSAGERLAYAVFDDSMSWDEKWAYAFDPEQMVADFVTGVVIGEFLDGMMAATQNKLRSIFANYDAAMREAIERGSSSRYDRTGYQSNGRSNNLFGRDRSTRRTTNLTEWRRSISQQDIHNEMRLFLGDDYVKIDSGKWRSLDGTRQFRVKPDDYLGNHGIGQPTVPNTPHVHFEFLTPRSNGNGFDVIKNIHVPIK